MIVKKHGGTDPVFDKKTLSEITVEEIANYRATRGKYKDTNRRIEGIGDVMDVLIAGANKIPNKSTSEKKGSDSV